jgi:metallo-beta-lactamase class B
VIELVENGERHVAVSIGSLSILPGVKLRARPTWPGIAESFARSYAMLRAIPCDVFLGSHGNFFDLDAKRKAQIQGAKTNPFVDPDGYRVFLDQAERKYREQLAREASN